MRQIDRGKRLRAAGAEFDRRSVLALAGLGAASLSTAGTGTAVAQTRCAIRYVITDRRYEESLEFGEALAKQGAIRLELTLGLTSLWQEVLLPHWRGRTGAVAGMSASGAWLALSEQARSEARPSALVGRHAMGSQSAAATHVLTAPRSVLALGVALDGQLERWPSVMAGLARCCARAPRSAVVEWRSQAPVAGGPTRYSLLSWIIA